MRLVARVFALGRTMLLMALIALCLEGCAPGSNGGDALAFIRAGSLWRMQPDGTTLYQVATGHIVGFSWSPDHHFFVFRAASKAPITSPAPLPVASVPESVSQLGVVSIDGGNIIAIDPGGAVARGDAFWDAQGNRLEYRERYGETVFWLQSQNDQPAGIARKDLGAFMTIPATSPDGSQVAIIGVDGRLLIGPPQGTPRAIASGALTTIAPAGRPARALWQPGKPAVLIPVAGPMPGTTILRRIDLQGKMQDLVTINGLDRWSFAPDGGHLLWRDALGYAMLNLATGQSVRWSEDDGIPWWSPDGKNILLITQDHASLILVGTGKVTRLAQWSSPLLPSGDVAQSLPATGNPWRADSQRFALALPGGQWLAAGKATALTTHAGAGTGLYIVDRASLAVPALVEWGEHGALSWSTPDPNTQWLWP